MGHAGAETALLELLRRLSPEEYDVSLYVLLSQGEMIHDVPEYVKVLNKKYDDSSVLSKKNKFGLVRKVLKAMIRRLTIIRNIPYLIKNIFPMIAGGRLRTDKLLWKILSDGGEFFKEEYDLAVAYLEGGSTYYVIDHVKADKKAAFVHVDYEQAGYTRDLDCNCYLKLDKIFTVSDEVKKSFLKAYPECEARTEVFHNLINQDRILEKSLLDGGFKDDFTGKRILTVGRLMPQKAFEISIEAMKLLKEKGENVRWYVLGEGDERKKLEELIEKLELKEDFILYGAVSNPYPYLKQVDIYVHASRFEGKSIAIQEAQILGKPILVSDCSGNREQVINGADGIMRDLTPEDICDGISELLHDEELCERIGAAAAKKNSDNGAQMSKLLSMI